MRWPVDAATAACQTAEYTLGIRPHHIAPFASGRDAVSIEGQRADHRAQRSESVIHFAHGPLSWVSQSHGVHAIEVGADAKFYIDVDRCMYFDADGKLIAS